MTDESFPPPGPVDGLGRLRVWMRARQWRQWLIVSLLLLVGWSALFGAWIGIALLRASTDRDAGAIAMNIVLVLFMGAVLFPTMHRATYRWFWHLDRKRAAGSPYAEVTAFRFGEEPTVPPPLVRWPWTLRLRHGAMLLLGVAALLYAFLPFANQIAIGRFLVGHSAGRVSAGSLGTLLFGYLPMLALAFVSMLLLSRQFRRRDAGLLTDEQKLLLAAEMNWLFAYATAFGATMLLCRIFGAMIVQYL